jgi:hypothetical protein
MDVIPESASDVSFKGHLLTIDAAAAPAITVRNPVTTPYSRHKKAGVRRRLGFA